MKSEKARQKFWESKVIYKVKLGKEQSTYSIEKVVIYKQFMNCSQDQ